MNYKNYLSLLLLIPVVVFGADEASRLSDEQICQSFIQSEYTRAIVESSEVWLLENGYKSAQDYAQGIIELYMMVHPSCVSWNNIKNQITEDSKIVRMPNGDLVRIPNDIPREEVAAAIRNKFPEYFDASGNPIFDASGEFIQPQ